MRLFVLILALIVVLAYVAGCSGGAGMDTLKEAPVQPIEANGDLADRANSAVASSGGSTVGSGGSFNTATQHDKVAQPAPRTFTSSMTSDGGWSSTATGR